MVRLTEGKRASRRPGRWLIFLPCLVLFPVVAPAAPAPAPVADPVAPTASSPLSLPTDVLPLPGTAAFQRGQQQRQLAALLRGFEGVTSAQVVIAGEAAAPRVSVLVKLNPRAQLRPALVQSMADVVLSAVPGLVPDRLTLATTAGETLYADGVPRIAAERPLGRSSGLPWAAPLAAVLLALSFTGWFLWRGRRPRNSLDETGLGFLGALNHHQLEAVFRDERGELVTLVASLCDLKTARRLRRYARSRGLPLLGPGPGLAEEVRQVVSLTLQAKARRNGIGPDRGGV